MIQQACHLLKLISENKINFIDIDNRYLKLNKGSNVLSKIELVSTLVKYYAPFLENEKLEKLKQKNLKFQKTPKEWLKDIEAIFNDALKLEKKIQTPLIPFFCKVADAPCSLDQLLANIELVLQYFPRYQFSPIFEVIDHVYDDQPLLTKAELFESLKKRIQ